jgi:hypothetical protein
MARERKSVKSAPSPGEQPEHSLPVVSQAEWRWVLTWSLVLCVVCVLPYVLGYLVARPNERFTGVLGQAIDVNSYLSRVRQGMAGRYLSINPYTSEPHAPMPFFLLYVWWGLATRLIIHDPAISYRLAQVVCTIGLLFAFYAFAALFVPTVRQRRMTFLVAALGAGVGWLTLPFVLSSGRPLSAIDLWMQEATFFSSMLSQPHFCAATALLLVTMRAFWLQLRAWSPWRLITLFVAPAAMILIHPFLVLTVTAVELAYAAIGLASRRLAWRPLLLTLLTEAVGMGAVLGVIQSALWLNPAANTIVTRQWSPPPQSYILGYGVLLPLAVWGAVLSARRRSDPFPATWLVVGALLPYAPVALQRRLIEGFFAPVALLASVALHDRVWPWLARRTRGWRAVLRTALVFSLVASNVVLWSIAGANALSHTEPWFVSQDEAHVWDWLQANGAPDQVVLCSPETGNRIPAHTNKRVVIGHVGETIRYADKARAVEAFFDPATSAATRAALLAEFSVRYVVWGPGERALGGLDPHRVPQLYEVYVNDEYTILAVGSGK